MSSVPTPERLRVSVVHQPDHARCVQAVRILLELARTYGIEPRRQDTPPAEPEADA